MPNVVNSFKRIRRGRNISKTFYDFKLCPTACRSKRGFLLTKKVLWHHKSQRLWTLFRQYGGRNISKRFTTSNFVQLPPEHKWVFCIGLQGKFNGIISVIRVDLLTEYKDCFLHFRKVSGYHKHRCCLRSATHICRTESSCQ